MNLERLEKAIVIFKKYVDPTKGLVATERGRIYMPLTKHKKAIDKQDRVQLESLGFQYDKDNDAWSALA